MSTITYTTNIAGIKVSIEKACARILQKVANEVSLMIKDNFLNESFFGNRWKEVNRRKWHKQKFKTKSGHTKQRTIPPVRGAAGRRRILTGSTGNLRRSIRYKIEGNTLTIYSDAIYAKIHNEGGMAGRGLKVRIPKRQFIGDHPRLRAKIAEIVENELKNLRL